MTASVAVTIPGKPRPQGSMRHLGGGRVVHASQTTPDHRAVVVAMLAEAWGGRPALDGPVILTAWFTFARPKSHYRSGRNSHILRPAHLSPHHTQTPDVDKLLRLLCDAAQAARVVSDDKQIVRVHGRKEWGDADETLLWIGQVTP